MPGKILTRAAMLRDRLTHARSPSYFVDAEHNAARPKLLRSQCTKRVGLSIFYTSTWLYRAVCCIFFCHGEESNVGRSRRGGGVVSGSSFVSREKQVAPHVTSVNVKSPVLPARVSFRRRPLRTRGCPPSSFCGRESHLSFVPGRRKGDLNLSVRHIPKKV